MGKKHVVKKRINKRKTTKPAAKPATQQPNKVDTKVMSKLEYEQSLMDPRFRAAMMGFNNPGLNYNQQFNNELRQHEVKNNELTRERAFQSDIAKLKQANQDLNNQLKVEKMQAKSELDVLRLQAENKFKEYEMNALTERAEFDKQYAQLNTAYNEAKRIHEDYQARAKQKEQELKTKYDLQVQQMQKQHDDVIIPLKQTINELARKSDLQNIKFNNTQEVAEAVNKLNIAQLNKLKQDIVEPIKETTNAINNLSKIEETRHQAKTQIDDALTQKLVAEFKAATTPTVNALSEQTNNINNKLQLLDTQIQAIKNIKQAKLKLNESQIQAISQPIVQKLELQHQALSDDLKLNKDIYDEIKKQNELKTRNAQLEQTIDPKIRNEYNEKVKQAKLETHELEIINSYAEAAHKAYQETEAVRSDIIDNAAKVLPNFNVDDIDDPAFTKQLLDKEVELRKRRAELIKKLELAKRSVDYQNKVEAVNFELDEAAARLEASTNPTPSFKNAIKTATQNKSHAEEQLNMLKRMSGTLDNLRSQQYATTAQAQEHLDKVLHDDQYFSNFAYNFTQQKHGNREVQLDDLPEITQAYEREIERRAKALHEFKGCVDDKFNYKIAKLYSEINGKYNLKELQQSLNAQIEQQQAEINELHADNEKLQHRTKQLAAYSTVLNNHIGNQTFSTEQLQYLNNLGVNG